LRGATCVVTGAAGGIGRALAARLADAGAKVAMLDLDEDALHRSAGEIEQRGAEVLALVCDITDSAAVAAAVGGVEARWGGIDVLVNNAGITHIGTLAETDEAVFRKVMDVNLFGALRCTRAALPSLIRRRGAIVVISSVAGFAPLFGRSGYAASKHALHGLFETLRCEVAADGVDVTMVCPGFTDTAIEAHALGGAARKTFGRLADADDVAAAVVAALAARRRLLVLTGVGKASWIVSRFFPGTYARMMTRRMS
jgi:NAD(P)-dependent dehydrogenase (short-subunit alcohol dehydrogenase family)